MCSRSFRIGKIVGISPLMAKIFYRPTSHVTEWSTYYRATLISRTLTNVKLADIMFKWLALNEQWLISLQFSVAVFRSETPGFLASSIHFVIWLKECVFKEDYKIIQDNSKEYETVTELQLKFYSFSCFCRFVRRWELLYWLLVSLRRWVAAAPPADWMRIRLCNPRVPRSCVNGVPSIHVDSVGSGEFFRPIPHLLQHPVDSLCVERSVSPPGGRNRHILDFLPGWCCLLFDYASPNWTIKLKTNLVW